MPLVAPIEIRSHFLDWDHLVGLVSYCTASGLLVISLYSNLVKHVFVCASKFRSCPLFERFRHYCIFIIDIHHNYVFFAIAWCEWELARSICVELSCILYYSIYLPSFLFYGSCLGVPVFFLVVTSCWPGSFTCLDYVYFLHFHWTG